MLYELMLMGIGFLSASVLMTLLAPLIHERAVRLTVRRLLFKRPRSALERRAHADQLRAQFAVSIRRLEAHVEETQAKTAGHLCDLAKKTSEVYRLKSEIRKLNVIILRFQARELMRRSTTRTIIKLIVYLHARAQRQDGGELAERGFRGRGLRKPEFGTVSA